MHVRKFIGLLVGMCLLAACANGPEAASPTAVSVASTSAPTASATVDPTEQVTAAPSATVVPSATNAPSATSVPSATSTNRPTIIPSPAPTEAATIVTAPSATAQPAIPSVAATSAPPTMAPSATAQVDPSVNTAIPAGSCNGQVLQSVGPSAYWHVVETYWNHPTAEHNNAFVVVYTVEQFPAATQLPSSNVEGAHAWVCHDQAAAIGEAERTAHVKKDAHPGVDLYVGLKLPGESEREIQ